MRRRALVLFTIGLVAATAGAMEIEVARAPEVDFSAYGSFGFRAKDGIPPGHPLGEESALLARIREAASRELLERGMTLIEGDTPDLWVIFFGLGQEEYSAEGVEKELGPVTWVGDPGAHSSRTVLHATLIVEIHDAATGERIWSGWATRSGSNTEKIRAKAPKAARKILQELPSE